MKQADKPKREYEKPLTLHPMTVAEAITKLAPKPKPKKTTETAPQPQTG